MFGKDVFQRLTFDLADRRVRLIDADPEAAGFEVLGDGLCVVAEYDCNTEVAHIWVGRGSREAGDWVEAGTVGQLLSYKGVVRKVAKTLAGYLRILKVEHRAVAASNYHYHQLVGRFGAAAE